MLAAEHHAFEIDFQYCVPGIHVYVRYGSRPVDAQHVHVAVAEIGGLGRHLAHIVVACHVAYEDGRLAALFADRCQRGLSVPLLPVCQQDPGALPGEQDGDGLPDADEVAAAGDTGVGYDGDLVAQAGGDSSVPFLET